MVQNMGSSFKALVKDRVDTYGKIAPAAAMFYNHNGGTGLRIEAPTLTLQFVDSLPFGRDPEGFLFYNNAGDITGKPTYNVFSNYGYTVDPGQEAVVVQFIDSDGYTYAEFVGQDPTRAVTSVINGKGGGQWVKLDQANTNVSIDKRQTSPVVVLAMNAIGRQVKFNITVTGWDKKFIHTTGTLYFKQITDLTDGVKSRIDYNDDRILFYPNTFEDDPNLKDLVAVFIPTEEVAQNAHDLGDWDFQSTIDNPATWGPIEY